MKKLLFGLLPLVFAASISAQTTPAGTVRPLTIGDTVPDMVFENMINYGAEKAQLSDFRGKAVILDFWSRGCLACIKAFPKMQDLQKQFEGKLQILLVTRDSKAKIAELFKHSEIAKNTSLPIAPGDKYLHLLFPHSAEPYHVWLDKDHVVRHTSSGYNATPENLGAFLEGRPVQFTDRQDNMDVRLSSENSILDAENRVTISNIKYSSLIAGKLNGFNKGTLAVLHDPMSKQTIGFRCTNMPIISLYQIAFKFPYKDRIILKVANPARYLQPDDPNLLQKWKLENTYCYELRKLPAFEMDNLYETMQKDLKRYFALEAAIENRSVRCLVLTKTSDLSNRLEQQAELSEPLFEKTREGYFMRNVTIEALLSFIRDEIGKPQQIPLIDETKIKGNISMILPVDCFRSVSLLRSELLNYGLELFVADRNIEMMILEE